MLLSGLENVDSSDASTALAIFGAMQGMVLERARTGSGFPSSADLAALQVLDTALLALVDTHERMDFARKLALGWERQRQRFKPDEEATSAMCEIAQQVEHTVVWYRRTGAVPCGAAMTLGPIGDEALRMFQSWLAERFGPNVPPMDDLKRWFSNHRQSTKKKTEITTTGIVVNVVARYPTVFGALSRCDRPRIVHDVQSVLKKHENAWWRSSRRQSIQQKD